MIKKFDEENNLSDPLIAEKLNNLLSNNRFNYFDIPPIRKRFDDYLYKHIKRNTAKRILIAIEIPVKDFLK